MSLLFSKADIVSDEEIIIPVVKPIGLSYQDISFSVALIGGKTAVAANVTALLTFHVQHFPKIEPVLLIDISKGGYRPDDDQTIGAAGKSGIESVGNAEEQAWVSFDQLNADEIVIKVNFDAIP
ncbi:unnamed protein product, partial [marine sediment metagenome]